MIEPHTDRLIAFLNELLALDQVWVQELIAARPVCNTDLALHPTVQVAVGGSNGAILIRPGETVSRATLGARCATCSVTNEGRAAVGLVMR